MGVGLRGLNKKPQVPCLRVSGNHVTLRGRGESSVFETLNTGRENPRFTGHCYNWGILRRMCFILQVREWTQRGGSTSLRRPVSEHKRLSPTPTPSMNGVESLPNVKGLGLLVSFCCSSSSSPSSFLFLFPLYKGFIDTGPQHPPTASLPQRLSKLL